MSAPVSAEIRAPGGDLVGRVHVRAGEATGDRLGDVRQADLGGVGREAGGLADRLVTGERVEHRLHGVGADGEGALDGDLEERRRRVERGDRPRPGRSRRRRR